MTGPRYFDMSDYRRSYLLPDTVDGRLPDNAVGRYPPSPPMLGFLVYRTLHDELGAKPATDAGRLPPLGTTVTVADAVPVAGLRTGRVVGYGHVDPEQLASSPTAALPHPVVLVEHPGGGPVQAWALDLLAEATG